MSKKLITAAALLGALAVGLGAFGAHGLKKVLTPENLQVFETGVRYQFYHVFALLVLVVLQPYAAVKWLRRAGGFFIAGIMLFSGSLYLLAFMPPGFRWVGAITPFGGVAFIAGWLCLAVAASSHNKLQ